MKTTLTQKISRASFMALLLTAVCAQSFAEPKAMTPTQDPPKGIESEYNSGITLTTSFDGTDPAYDLTNSNIQKADTVEPEYTTKSGIENFQSDFQNPTYDASQLQQMVPDFPTEYLIYSCLMDYEANELITGCEYRTDCSADITESPTTSERLFFMVTPSEATQCHSASGGSILEVRENGRVLCSFRKPICR